MSSKYLYTIRLNDNQDIWIGGIHTEDEQTWQWSDGKDFDFDFVMGLWVPEQEQPNNEQRCLRFHLYKPSTLFSGVSHENCSTELQFVCHQQVVCQVDKTEGLPV